MIYMEQNIEIPTDDIERFSVRFSLGRDRGMGSRQFLRIKVPGGVLTSKQLRSFAQLSKLYGRCYAEITDRQDIQLHWIEGKDAPEIFAKLDALGFTTDKCGQAFPAARYGDTRNIVVCPATGVNKNELIDVAPIAKKINDFFTGNRDYLDLPRKFKISITGCELGCTRPEMQDLGLFAVKKDGGIGFVAIVGGALGPSQPGPRLGKPLGIFIRPEEVFDAVKVIVDLFKEHGNRESKPKARFKWLVETWGVDKVRAEFERKLGRRLERFDHGYPEVSGEEHMGVQKQGAGKVFVNVPVIGGVLTSEKLAGIADISDEFGGGEIRLTPYQNFIIPHIPEGRLDAVRSGLEKLGFSLKEPPLRWMIVGCASDFCGKSVEPHAKQVAEAIVERLGRRFGEKLNDLKVLIHISGCVHDCGLHSIGQIGIIGVKSAAGGSMCEFYNLSVGGALGAKSSFARQVGQMLAPDDLMKMVEKLVEACIDEGFNDFGEFCRAHKLDELRLIANR